MNCYFAISFVSCTAFIKLFYRITFLLGVISTVVQDSPNKVFIGGLPNFLNEDQVSTSDLSVNIFSFYKFCSFIMEYTIVRYTF